MVTNLIDRIEFTLPWYIASLPSAAVIIIAKLDEWSSRHKVPHKRELVGIRVFLRFAREEEYNFFLLSWDAEYNWQQPKLILN